MFIIRFPQLENFLFTTNNFQQTWKSTFVASLKKKHNNKLKKRMWVRRLFLEPKYKVKIKLNLLVKDL